MRLDDPKVLVITIANDANEEGRQDDRRRVLRSRPSFLVWRLESVSRPHAWRLIMSDQIKRWTGSGCRGCNPRHAGEARTIRAKEPSLALSAKEQKIEGIEGMEEAMAKWCCPDEDMRSDASAGQCSTKLPKVHQWVLGPEAFSVCRLHDNTLLLPVGGNARAICVPSRTELGLGQETAEIGGITLSRDP